MSASEAKWSVSFNDFELFFYSKSVFCSIKIETDLTGSYNTTRLCDLLND